MLQQLQVFLVQVVLHAHVEAGSVVVPDVHTWLPALII